MKDTRVISSKSRYKYMDILEISFRYKLGNIYIEFYSTLNFSYLYHIIIVLLEKNQHKPKMVSLRLSSQTSA